MKFTVTAFALTTALLCAGVAQAADPESAPKSCNQELGRKKAAVLVEQCKMVSPATRPPCHAANACELIREEIKRSCKLMGDDKGTPKFCKEAK